MKKPETPPQTPDGTPPPGHDPNAGFDALGVLVDELRDESRAAGTVAAAQIRKLESTRQFAVQIQHDPTLNRYKNNDDARRGFMTEIALALNITENAAHKKISLGEHLVATLTRTLDTLSEGLISERHAFAIAQFSEDCTPADMLAFEEQVLPKALTMNPAKFERYARQLRDKLHPELMAEAHTKALDERRVQLFPLRDGMCEVVATVDAPFGVGLMNALIDEAGALKNIEGETRTIAQLEADVFRDRFLGSYFGGCGVDSVADQKDGKTKQSGRSNGTYGGFAPRVNIMVPALSLLGKSDEPAVLAGYGPIDIDTAKELAGESTTWRRILTDPDTGQMLTMSSTRYTPPTDLAEAVRLRDGVCREPGCNNPAEACEIDHSLAWAKGGMTEFMNLGAFCRKHHKVKHFMLVSPEGIDIGPAVTVDHLRDEAGRPTGEIRWSTVTGHFYISEPQLSARALKKIRDAEAAEKRKTEPPFEWAPKETPMDGSIEPF